MRSTIFSQVFTICFLVTMVAPVDADEKNAGKNSKSSNFEKIKALSGEWEVTRSPDGHGEHGGMVTYKITAGGSAVIETLFGGTDHEMITLYYMDGDDLALTHYCVLQNRPLMREEKQPQKDKVVLKCQKAENAKIENEDHMHQVTYTFVDTDHVKTDWVLYKGGKADSTHSFEIARKKKPAK